jgi:sulfhydrogenase subunit beta (sulfur reductase)
MQVQDRTFLEGQWSPFTDPYYATRRRNLFVVAVNCTRAAATCFCASQSAGPKAGSGYDLALTEMEEGLLVEAGSEAGEAIAMRLHLRAANGLMDEAMAAIEACGASQSRYIDNEGLFDLLMANLDHPRWDDVAARCLSCANCVMVCPTCFCHREHDVAAMDGSGADHVRQWDACFTLEHGSVHGGQLRPGVRDRYRQWLTHKVGSWQPQFGTSGCVGCGRCITWCPTGIDLTEEIAVIRAQPGLTR